MKYVILFISFLSFTTLAYPQCDSCLIAHWDMKGETNDISGNGNNGIGINLIPAAGVDGIMGHAWYFNGVNSKIRVPYSPVFNLSRQYTIAAQVKVEGFYSGTCVANTLLVRGHNGTCPGNYTLYFSCQPATGGGCLVFDSLSEDFQTGSYDFQCTIMSAFNYTPYITENTWYNIVATFNDTVFKLYVNGMLMNSYTACVNAGGTFAASTDGICLGFDSIGSLSGYPYQFKGAIGDMRLYNCALNDSAIIHLYDNCNLVSAAPTPVNLPSSGGTAIYTVSASIPGASYQWQVNMGTGFVNLSNAGPYTGVTTAMLTVSGATISMNNYLYRCIITNSWCCTDTTAAARLTLGVNNLKTDLQVVVYPDPAGAEVCVQLPGNTISGHIDLVDDLGRILETRIVYNNKVNFNLEGLAAGVYILKIDVDGEVLYKRLLKK